MRTLALAISLTCLAAAPTLAAEAHPLTVHDMLAMQRISAPRPSPRGDRVAFVLRTTDLEKNRGANDIWAVGLDGSGLARLTSDEAADTEPRWSPDGSTLYFLSTRSGSSQVWRVPAAGGEATQVTRLPLDVGTFAVSPDGRLLALSMEVFVDCDTPACTADRVAEVEKRAAKGQVYDRLFVRHWDTWKEGRRSHLFVVPVAGGEPVDLTRGLDADVPSKPFGGAEDFAFSPDGRRIVFSARDAGREEPWSTDFDLYEVPVDGSARPRNLTEANPAWDTRPVFSPDGRSLAYLAMSRPGYEADRYRVLLRDLASGREREVAGSWDRSPNDLAFSRDGRTLYASAPQRGHVPLFAIDVATGAVRELVAEGSVHEPAVVPGGPSGGPERLVFGLDHLRSPTELWTVRADGSGPTQITGINRERLAAVQMGEPEQFSFPGAGGDTVWGWVVKPAGYQQGRKYPVAFLIHGGPQSSFRNDFHYRWNPQAYAGAGYAAVMIDFHGSVGYGQAFTDAIRGDWGGKPLVDLQKGLEAAIARYPFLDGDRVCALGASYGGYMINWIAGNWPDRFRCLVNHDGIFDQRMMYYSTEELWFPEWEQEGLPWESPEGYEKHNPVNHVAKWKTPMLVVHGALDYRVPYTQGLAAFTALQRRGIPSRLLYLPNENHWVLKPANSIQWHDTVLAWLDRWLAPGPRAAAGRAP